MTAHLDVINQCPAWLEPSERLLLYALVFGLRPQRVLEIGTLHGGSAQIITGALDDVGHGRLISVDPAPDLKIDWDTIAHRATLLRGYSPALLPEARAHAGGPFDFCFIDANHSYNGVWADGCGVLRHMSPGGYVLFHDAHHPSVRDAIDDLVTTVFGISDCGTLSRDKREWVDDLGGPWAGLRLLRVRSNRGFRLPRLWVRILRKLTRRRPLP